MKLEKLVQCRQNNRSDNSQKPRPKGIDGYILVRVGNARLDIRIGTMAVTVSKASKSYQHGTSYRSSSPLLSSPVSDLLPGSSFDCPESPFPSSSRDGVGACMTEMSAPCFSAMVASGRYSSHTASAKVGLESHYINSLVRCYVAV